MRGLPRRAVVIAALLAAGAVIILSRDDESRAPAATATPAAAAVPYLQASWSGRVLRLQGHAPADTAALHSMTARLFGIDEPEGRLEAHPALPEGWSQMATNALELLAVAVAGELRLGDGRIELQAVVDDDADWQRRVAALRASLPAGLSLDETHLLVAQPASEASLCKSAFAALSLRPIYFLESTDALRPSATPELERLAAFANTCRRGSIRITGHTDSSGDETQNLRLSEQRAAAVAGVLAAHGIDADRLIVSGKGSAEPVASNATRYGRGLNRRIELAWEPCG